MGLKASLAAGPPPDPRSRCAVRDWLEGQSDDDRAAFAEVAEKARGHLGGWNMRKLSDVCAANGLSVKYDRLAKHLRGDCPCGPRG